MIINGELEQYFKMYVYKQFNMIESLFFPQSVLKS